MAATLVNDWERLVGSCPWLTGDGISTEIGEPRPARRVALSALPRLSALMSAATLTPVVIDGVGHELLAWGPESDRRGWLCLPPGFGSGPDVHELQRLVWTVTGGIVEHFGGNADWWWLNHNDVLTARAAKSSVREILSSYQWIWEDSGLEMPINPDDYSVTAIEANGNLTLAHRRSGEVIWFAPDHDLERVSVLPGNPEYSLYTFDDAPDVASWIETGVAQWTTGWGSSLTGAVPGPRTPAPET